VPTTRRAKSNPEPSIRRARERQHLAIRRASTAPPSRRSVIRELCLWGHALCGRSPLATRRWRTPVSGSVRVRSAETTLTAWRGASCIAASPWSGPPAVRKAAATEHPGCAVMISLESALSDEAVHAAGSSLGAARSTMARRAMGAFTEDSGGVAAASDCVDATARRSAGSVREKSSQTIRSWSRRLPPTSFDAEEAAEVVVDVFRRVERRGFPARS
jgi:hypothetical protein